MIKIVEIDCCSNCPHQLRINGGKRKCRISGSKTIDAPITIMPRWCPLPDRQPTPDAANKEGLSLSYRCPVCQNEYNDGYEATICCR